MLILLQEQLEELVEERKREETMEGELIAPCSFNGILLLYC